MGSEAKQSKLTARLKALSPGKLVQLKQETTSNLVSGNMLVAESLQACGIKRVFGISGTPVDAIFAECAARDIRPISAPNQQCAVLMSAAGNYIAGRLECAVVVSAGPGVTNTVTAVHVAQENGWPVLVLGGRRALDREGIGYFQELDAVPLLAPFTKLAITVRRTTEISQVISQAFEIAVTGRRGPVYIDLPEDVLQGYARAGSVRTPQKPRPQQIDLNAVREAARIVTQASKPLLILGEDIRWSFDAEPLRRLVEDFGIPFITAPMGRGYVPDNHVFSANAVRRYAQRQADVVLMVGAWFDWRFRFGTELAPGARVIHANADTTTLGKNVSECLCIAGEPGEFLAALAGALGREANGEGKPCFSTWHKTLNQARAENSVALEVWLQQTSRPLLPQQLYLAIRDLLPNDSIIALEGNICLAAAQKILQAHRPVSWIDPGRSGIIGASVAFAMGAKLADPQRPVFALCSDTGFAMSAMELEAAVRHRIPVVVVIANNDGNGGAVRQRTFFPAGYAERFSQFLPELRYERIIEIFGGHAEYVTEVSQIRPAFERAIASGLPACLNVQLNPDAPHSGFW